MRQLSTGLLERRYDMDRRKLVLREVSLLDGNVCMD